MWPYVDEPPPDVAESHRQRLREPPRGSLLALIHKTDCERIAGIQIGAIRNIKLGSSSQATTSKQLLDSISKNTLGSRGDGISARDPRDRRTPRLETDDERHRSGVHTGEHRRAKTTRDVGAASALRTYGRRNGSTRTASPSIRTPLSPSSKPSTATQNPAPCRISICLPSSRISDGRNATRTRASGFTHQVRC